MTCADVTFDMADKHYGESTVDAMVGDLLWNPKGGDGHVLIGEAVCGDPMRIGQHPDRRADCGCGGWLGKCGSPTQVCECGEDDSWRDHHYVLLALVAPKEPRE